VVAGEGSKQRKWATDFYVYSQCDFAAVSPCESLDASDYLEDKSTVKEGRAGSFFLQKRKGIADQVAQQPGFASP
jgi:hypothetical protein